MEQKPYTPPEPKFHVRNAGPMLVDAARRLYAAYTDNAHNLNYQGLPCPAWGDLGDSVRSHWCAVAGSSLSEEFRSSLSNPPFPKEFDFGIALKILRAGGAVARAGWNGKGVQVQMQIPDAHSKMGLPYLYLRTVDGKLVPWTASQSDVLADDWIQA